MLIHNGISVDRQRGLHLYLAELLDSEVQVCQSFLFSAV